MVYIFKNFISPEKKPGSSSGCRKEIFITRDDIRVLYDLKKKKMVTGLDAQIVRTDLFTNLSSISKRKKKETW